MIYQFYKSYIVKNWQLKTNLLNFTNIIFILNSDQRRRFEHHIQSLEDETKNVLGISCTSEDFQVIPILIKTLQTNNQSIFRK